MVAASLTGYPAAFYLYLYICIMTIYAKNIKYHMEYYVTGPFFLITSISPSQVPSSPQIDPIIPIPTF